MELLVLPGRLNSIAKDLSITLTQHSENIEEITGGKICSLSASDAWRLWLC
jgi:hypothetical protein